MAQSYTSSPLQIQQNGQDRLYDLFNMIMQNQSAQQNTDRDDAFRMAELQANTQRDTAAQAGIPGSMGAMSNLLKTMLDPGQFRDSGGPRYAPYSSPAAPAMAQGAGMALNQGLAQRGETERAGMAMDAMSRQGFDPSSGAEATGAGPRRGAPMAAPGMEGPDSDLEAALNILRSGGNLEPKQPGLILVETPEDAEKLAGMGMNVGLKNAPGPMPGQFYEDAPQYEYNPGLEGYFKPGQELLQPELSPAQKLAMEMWGLEKRQKDVALKTAEQGLQEQEQALAFAPRLNKVATAEAEQAVQQREAAIPTAQRQKILQGAGEPLPIPQDIQEAESILRPIPTGLDEFTDDTYRIVRKQFDTLVTAYQQMGEDRNMARDHAQQVIGAYLKQTSPAAVGNIDADNEWKWSKLARMFDYSPTPAVTPVGEMPALPALKALFSGNVNWRWNTPTTAYKD